jgi:malate permease and related proteins
MLGYAVYTTLFGVEHLSRFAVVDLGQVIFVFFILIPGLQADLGSKPGWQSVLSGFLKTPVILAILIGLAANLTGLYRLAASVQIFKTIFDSMNILAGLTMPLVTLIIGYELNLNRHAMKPAIRTITTRLAVWMLFAFLLNTFVIRAWLGLDRYFEAAVYLMMVLPAPFVVPFYTHDSDQASKDAVLNTLSLGALVALIASVVIGIIYA